MTVLVNFDCLVGARITTRLFEPQRQHSLHDVARKWQME